MYTFKVRLDLPAAFSAAVCSLYPLRVTTVTTKTHLVYNRARMRVLNAERFRSSLRCISYAMQLFGHRCIIAT